MKHEGLPSVCSERCMKCHNMWQAYMILINLLFCVQYTEFVCKKEHNHLSVN
jgi:hypothetical protein